MAEHSAFVHVGAHRTGSSSFQMFLGHNKSKLESAGFTLFYPARDGAPGGYQKKFRLPTPDFAKKENARLFKTYVKPFRQRVAAQLDPARPKILISEENILGRMAYFFQGNFYPGVEQRLKVTAKGLNLPIQNVTLVMRNYVDLYTSSYTMFAQIKAQQPFENLIPQLVGMKTGWPELVDQILEHTGCQQLTVVPYEHRGSDETLLHHLCGDIPSDLEPAPARANISASSEAIAEIQRRFIAGETLTKLQTAEIVAQFPVSEGFARFAPFAMADRRLLTVRYQTELVQLSKRKDIHLVTS